MLNIFISYNRQSEAIARILIADFESLGYAAWFDQDLSGGQVWWDQILANIRNCDVFVFLLDPNSLSSNACIREIGYAADLGKPIIPFLVADGVSTALLPPELSQLQYVDYRKQDRNTALRLARALASIPPAKSLPHPLPPPPEVPVSYLGGLTRKIDGLSNLSFEEQSALVVDLKRSIRDPGSSEDALILFKKLRSRRDLFATIAEEIDDLIGKPTQKAAFTFHKPVPEPPPKADKSIQKDTGHLSTKLAANERRLGALFGTIIGIALGISMSLLGIGSIEGVITNGIAGAAAGAICGRQKRKIIIASIGLISGFIFWVIIDNGQLDINYYSYRFQRALIYGTPIGAILGALIGSYIKREKE